MTSSSKCSPMSRSTPAATSTWRTGPFRQETEDALAERMCHRRSMSQPRSPGLCFALETARIRCLEGRQLDQGQRMASSRLRTGILQRNSGPGSTFSFCVGRRRLQRWPMEAGEAVRGNLLNPYLSRSVRRTSVPQLVESHLCCSLLPAQ